VNIWQDRSCCHDVPRVLTLTHDAYACQRFCCSFVTEEQKKKQKQVSPGYKKALEIIEKERQTETDIIYAQVHAYELSDDKNEKTMSAVIGSRESEVNIFILKDESECTNPPERSGAKPEAESRYVQLQVRREVYVLLFSSSEESRGKQTADTAPPGKKRIYGGGEAAIPESTANASLLNNV